jgi:rifampicin phosphotransferase
MTTPAWTPLFRMAGGIVTDFGGPLSHSSTVAREYGITAVPETGGTSKIIMKGHIITVYGDRGEVRIENGYRKTFSPCLSPSPGMHLPAM